MKHLAIIGGGFSGFWSAMSAVRQARELGKPKELKITLITKDEFHSIRPRFYEENLDGLRIPLKNYLYPLGVKLVVDEVTSIDSKNNLIAFGSGREKITYDYLILAPGSALKANVIPGFERTFNVDTFDDATAFDRHIRGLSNADFSTQASKTFVVVGGGFTGLEVITALPQRIGNLSANVTTEFNFILIDRSTELAPSYSVEAQKYIQDQLKASNINLMLGEELERIESGKIILKTGKAIVTDTVVWATGLVASPLTRHFKGNQDPPLSG